MILSKKTTRSNIYLDYYTALNGILKLTKLELNILAEFSLIDYLNPGEDIFTRSNRDIVMLKLDISKFNLNNYIKNLKTKGIIVKNKNNKLIINPSLKLDGTLSYYDIQFKFNIEK